MYVSLYEEDLNNINETVYGMDEALDQHDINYRGFWQTYDHSPVAEALFVDIW